MPPSFHGELDGRSLVKYAWWRAPGPPGPRTLSLRKGERGRTRGSFCGGGVGGRSVVKYAWWRAGGRRGPETLSLRKGGAFQLRPGRLGAGGNNDYGVAYDVFVDRYYDQVAADPAT